MNRNMERMLDDIYFRAEQIQHISMERLAARSGLSETTIYRIRNRKYKRSPLFTTVLKLAKAVGMLIEGKETKAQKLQRYKIAYGG